MTKVLLATFGTLGDIYPFIAIAHALRRRGTTPVIAAPEVYRRTIEGEAIAFARLRPDVTDVAAALGTDLPGAFKIMLKNPHFILDEIYMRFLSETYEDVMRAGADADAVLSHSLLVGAHQAAEKLRRPSARVALAPLHLQSAASPSMTPSAPYILEPKNCAAKDYNRVVRSVVRLSVEARMGRLRAFRRRVGLPRTREDFFLDFGEPNSADAVFGLFSPRPCRTIPPTSACPASPSTSWRKRTAARSTRACAHSSRPARRRSSSRWARSRPKCRAISTIDASAPPALSAVGPCSSPAPRMRRVSPPWPVPTSMSAQAPHSLLFPTGLCVVHHGGIGTTAEALRAGKPQIVVPFFDDQPDHGARIERLGLGFSIKLSAFDEARAEAALRELLAGGHAARARRFAAAIADEPGVDAVADWAAHVTSPEMSTDARRTA